MQEEILLTNSAATHPISLLRAQRVAARAHAGQREKQGLPFITHCERLSRRLTTTEERIVAFLHDTLEKSLKLTSIDLEREGFSSRVIGAVLALTRRPGEPDHSFLIRIANDDLASNVKLVDLEDNILQCQNAGLDSSHYERSLEMFLGMKGWTSAYAKTPAYPSRHGFVRSLLTELGLVSPGRKRRSQ